jgi:hypothetical protein
MKGGPGACKRARFFAMRSRDRNVLQDDWNQRFGAVARKVAESSAVAFAPWLRPGMSLSALRRTVARLRSGAIRLADPRISPLMLAQILEDAIAKELVVRWMVATLGGNNELRRSIAAREERERVRHLVAGFHRLKKSPEAQEPDSPAAQRVRRLHRERRNELGRPRRRKR